MKPMRYSVYDEDFEIAGDWFTPQNSRLPEWAVMAIISGALILVGCLFLLISAIHSRNVENGVFDPVPEAVDMPVLEPLGDVSTDRSYTEKLDTVINDVALSIYIPHNASPELALGVPDIKDETIILCAQAADIRADNGQILGAFVLKGEPKAWGLSKKGYCAILDGKITVGVADNSPLFEEATETGGYFFRQYPLVDNGVLVENAPKNKSMRKALCNRSGQILMVVSETDESFHDFAQALIDLGVFNAVYLVGSHVSYGWYRNANDQCEEFAAPASRTVYANETYILWRSEASPIS